MKYTEALAKFNEELNLSITAGWKITSNDDKEVVLYHNRSSLFVQLLIALFGGAWLLFAPNVLYWHWGKQTKVLFRPIREHYENNKID